MSEPQRNPSRPGRGVFFTSIPKAGKNLIYTFAGALAIGRSDIPREDAVWAVEEAHLRRARRTCTYALPPCPQPADLAAGFNRFVTSLDRLLPGTILHHHFAFDARLADALQRAQIPIVFLRRDPRDILVSMADYILAQGKPAHLATRYAGLSRPEIIEHLWTGDQELMGFADYVETFRPWTQAAGVEGFAFEDLIGERGGGGAARQRAALERLAGVFQIGDLARFERACSATYNSRAGTFFKGLAGRWTLETDLEIAGILRSPAMSTVAAAWGYAA